MAGSGNGAARRFNTAGICYPEEHYMVNMEKRLQEIEGLVDQGAYFTVNRARQYGKQRCLICLQKGFPAGMPYCLSALKE